MKRHSNFFYRRVKRKTVPMENPEGRRATGRVVVVGVARRVRKVTDQTLESLSRPDPQPLQTMSGSAAGK